MLRLEEPGLPLVEGDVEEFETKLKKRLPLHYRNFLLQFNGGRPTPDIIEITGDSITTDPLVPSYGLPGETNVDTLFGLGDSVTACDLEWNTNIFQERIAQIGLSLLPIACDSGGNIFFLGLDEETYGTIYYGDMQSVFANYDAVPPLYLVAPDFNAFLELLHDT